MDEPAHLSRVRIVWATCLVMLIKLVSLKKGMGSHGKLSLGPVAAAEVVEDGISICTASHDGLIGTIERISPMVYKFLHQRESF